MNLTQIPFGFGNQRWTAKRASYRPAGETIIGSRYDVRPIASDATAKEFVQTHHYSGTYPAARYRFGLYRRKALVGVAVFSHPCSDSVLTRAFPSITMATEAVELGRFVLLDEVPGNGETWFLARCFDQLRPLVYGVVSFSDPIPRERADGCLVFPGHIGTIYQAHNAAYLGRGKGRTLQLLPDGRVFSDRAMAKIRSLDKGWAYSVAQLEAAGARTYQGGEDPDAAREWLGVELGRVCRRMKHPGNFKYAWSLHRKLRKDLPRVYSYPKARGLALAA